MATNLAIFALALVAAARLNRLLVRDFITQPLRATLSNQQNPISRFVAAMLLCTWCTGMYTGFATAALAHWITGATWHALPLSGLAIAWGAPVLAAWLDPEPAGDEDEDDDLIAAEIIDDTPEKD